MVTQINPYTSTPTVTWQSLPDDYTLLDDPVENIQQPLLAADLTEALDTAAYIQPEMLIASNFALVATVNNKIVVKALDWFYVPQVQPVEPGIIRRSYTPNIQGNMLPWSREKAEALAAKLRELGIDPDAIS